MVKPSPHLSPASALKIHDLEAISILLAYGIEPTGTEFNGERVYFVFPNSPEAQTALVRLASGDLRFDPHSLIEAFRKARRLLFEVKQRAGSLRAGGTNPPPTNDSNGLTAPMTAADYIATDWARRGRCERGGR